MAGSRQESAANESCPERIGLPEAGSEIEHAEFAGGVSNLMNVRPSAGNIVNDGRYTEQRSRDINPRLYDVGPNYRRQAALEGINQRQHGDDCDGHYFS